MIKALLLYVSILVFLSLNPWLRVSSHSAIAFITWDMLAHAAAYGTLALLLMSAMVGKRQIPNVTTLVLVICGFGGVFMEFCQYWFTETRELSWSDALANLLGGMMGVLVFWTAHYFYPALLGRFIGWLNAQNLFKVTL